CLKIPMGGKLGYMLTIIFFYVPNILQTLFIVISWPINFYFVKACIFILVLSLTRNMSYFFDKLPGDFLITSTTFIQVFISNVLKVDKTNKRAQISIDEMQTKMNKMQATMDEMKRSMEEMKRN